MATHTTLTFTVEEAAELLGISRGLAYQAAATGELPVVRVGGRILVPRARLMEMLGERDAAADAQPTTLEGALNAD